MPPAPRLLAILLILSCAASPALAHDVTGVAGGLASGFAHPINGWDHVIAMVAVGLWGALLGNPGLWLLPVAFPLAMAAGSALGIAAVPLPAVETAIALSGIVLGLAVAFAVRPPLAIALALVGTFAVFHGYAHGREMPGSADAGAYAIGFVLATGLLHLSGIALGGLTRWDGGRAVVRATGGIIAMTGFGYLVGAL